MSPVPRLKLVQVNDAPGAWHTPEVPDAAPDHHRLIVQLRHGHEDALRVLYDEFSSMVYRLCLRMLQTPHDAEETLQDTFLRLEAQAEKYDANRGSVQTFVLTIAHHLCLERLRARRSRPQASDALGEEGFLQLAAPTPARDPLDRALVEAALRDLPELDQTLLEAMFFDGYTHSEITARTGLPLGTVKSRLRRALLKLKERMES